MAVLIFRISALPVFRSSCARISFETGSKMAFLSAPSFCTIPRNFSVHSSIFIGEPPSARSSKRDALFGNAAGDLPQCRPHPLHILLRLAIGRDAAMLVDGAFAGVVGGQDEIEVAAIAIAEPGQIRRPGGKI